MVFIKDRVTQVRASVNTAFANFGLSVLVFFHHFLLILFIGKKILHARYLRRVRNADDPFLAVERPVASALVAHVIEHLQKAYSPPPNFLRGYVVRTSDVSSVSSPPKFLTETTDK